MSSSRLRYSSMPREGGESGGHFSRLDPATSSLRCEGGGARCRVDTNSRTLPGRGRIPNGEQEQTDGQNMSGGGRLARVTTVRRRPSQPTKLNNLYSHCPTDPAMSSTKSSSLPGHTGTSPVSLDPLAVPAEDLASQLTLLDLPVFRAIAAEELMSCSWNKKNKRDVAPNIVASIRSFNHVSFWAVQEVLKHEDLKSRIDTLAHFIKVAKKLHELNNLQSEFAVLSALQSAAIYRLSKTWSGLARHSRQTFDKLADLFSDRDNWTRLRNHMNSNALKHGACIPYLGLYLTDLMMVDIAHPSTGGLDSDHRQFRMNNIMRLIAELQHSSFAYNIQTFPSIQSYLRDVRYIDELQKFLEDDQFKLSERLEPNSPAVSSTSSKESVRSSKVQSYHPDLLQELNLSPARGGSKVSRAPAPGKPFVPGHRKSKSEGGNIFFSCAGSGLASPEIPTHHKGRPRVASCDSLDKEKISHYSLLDGSLLDDAEVVGPNLTSPSPPVLFSPDSEEAVLTLSPDETGERPISLDPGASCTYQGFVQRKTLLKDGKRPLVSSWQKYWLQLWGSSLVYFLPKTLSKSRERRDFKSEPCKLVTVEGWLVMLPDANQDVDFNSFQLADPVMRNIYRFRDAGTGRASWVYHLTRATRGHTMRPLPSNLISFE